MIFVRSTVREFTAIGIAVFLVLLVITFTTQLIRLLGSAAGGGIPTDAVLVLLGFAALGYLSVLLSATLFLSVLLSLTRAYRDSEMVVWQSSGLGLTAWFGPVLLYAAPILLLVGLLSLYLTPWALGKTEQFRHQLENRDDVSAVAPGVFKESKNGERVFFVEKVSTDLRQVANIFVHVSQDKRSGVIVAKRGYTEVKENGDRYLVLEDGRRYEGTPGQADYRVAHFDRYAFRIEQKEATAFFPNNLVMQDAVSGREVTRIHLKGAFRRQYKWPYAVIHRELGVFGFTEMVVFAVVVFASFLFLISNGALEWGPLKREQPVATDGIVSTTRTTTSTIRRVGLEGRAAEGEAA